MQSNSEKKAGSSSSGPLVAGVAAAAVTAGMAAGQARASVVYTPFTATVDAANPSVPIDFDGDGIPELTLNYDSTNGLTLTVGSSQKMEVVTTAPPSDGTVAALPYGEQINGTAPTGDQYTKITYDGFEGTGTSVTINDGTTPDGGFTEANGLQYIGVDLFGTTSAEDPFDDNYGWIGYQVTDDSSLADLSANIVDFAYDTTDDEAIGAGQVPEPTSLALLAMGIVGLGMYRRRGGCAHV
jgi:hypothetical protein